MKPELKATRIGGAVIAVLTIASAAPQPAVAQGRPMYELPPVTVVALSDADELHLEAVALYEFPERWAEAARLHEQAARKLAHNDAQSFAAYDRAARLYFYAGEYANARRSMERAAGVAIATGDLVTAAHAYIDAAFITLWEGRSGAQGELTRQAERLSASELIGEAERDEILVRIRQDSEPERTVVAIGEGR